MHLRLVRMLKLTHRSAKSLSDAKPRTPSNVRPSDLGWSGPSGGMGRNASRKSVVFKQRDISSETLCEFESLVVVLRLD